MEETAVNPGDGSSRLSSKREEKTESDIANISAPAVCSKKMKLNVLDDADGYVDQNSGRNKWICKLCGKEFGSAKALGGHKRVHKVDQMQNIMKVNMINSAATSSDNISTHGIDVDDSRSYNSLSKSRITRKKGRSYLKDVIKNGKPTCSVCKRTFPSLKSLYGHMNRHPERQWRGMKLPSSSSTPLHPAADAHPKDNLGSTSNSIISANSSTLSLEENLVEGHPYNAESSDYVPAAAAGAVVKVENDHLLPLRWSTKAKRGRRSRSTSLEVEDDDNDDHRKKKIVLDLEVSGLLLVLAQDNIQQHAAVQENQVSSNNGSTGIACEHHHYYRRQAQSCYGDAHTCQICKKSFSTGQALGGHKRCHRIEGPKSNPPVLNSTPATATTTTRVHDFDLNELPPADSEP